MQLVLLHACRSTPGCGNTKLNEIVGDPVAPRLYALGSSMEQWAAAVLDQCGCDELILVGSSVVGSCAIEMACASPE